MPNIGLSPAVGFSNKNDSLAYFAILGELSSGLSFTVGFSKTMNISLIISLLFRGGGGGKEGYTSQHPNVLVGLRRPNIRRELFLVFCTKFERHTSP